MVFRRAPDSVGEMGSSIAVVRNGKMDLYHKRSGKCVQMLSFAEEGVGPCVLADQDGSGQLIVVATPSKVIVIFVNRPFFLLLVGISITLMIF